MDSETVPPTPKFDSQPVGADDSTIFGEAVPKRDIYDDDIIDPVYRAKAHVINKAMVQVGMGRYQWMLWVVAGFGWFA
jgi:hypothetical protein